MQQNWCSGMCLGVQREKEIVFLREPWLCILQIIGESELHIIPLQTSLGFVVNATRNLFRVNLKSRRKVIEPSFISCVRKKKRVIFHLTGLL